MPEGSVAPLQAELDSPVKVLVVTVLKPNCGDQHGHS